MVLFWRPDNIIFKTITPPGRLILHLLRPNSDQGNVWYEWWVSYECIIRTDVNIRLVRAWQSEQDQTREQPLDLFWQIWLFGLWQALRVGENPLSGEGEVGPGVRIVPFPCSHNAWLMTVCRAPRETVGKPPAPHTHTHTRMGACWPRCHGNPVLQLSSVHQFPQQHP